MKAYQADMAEFERAGTQVIGISVDSPATNKAFAESLGASCPILSDTGRAISRAYGALIPIVRLARRTTFAIDRQGVIQSIYRGKQAIDPGAALAGCRFESRI